MSRINEITEIRLVNKINLEINGDVCLLPIKPIDNSKLICLVFFAIGGFTLGLYHYKIIQGIQNLYVWDRRGKFRLINNNRLSDGKYECGYFVCGYNDDYCVNCWENYCLHCGCSFCGKQSIYREERKIQTANSSL